MMDYKLLSWNVNGLNSPQKRKEVFHWLKKQKCSIICLQETHIRRQDYKYLENQGLGLNFYSSAVNKKKGVAFYLKKELEPIEIFKDNHGRYIAIEVTLNLKKTLLLGVYAPNDGKDKFFQELTLELDQVSYEHVMIFGDFNGIIDAKLDRTSKDKKSFEGRLPKSFFKLMIQEKLEDIWRWYNKTVKDYTFYSARHKSFSRIDMVWASKDICLATKRIQILPKTFSDHSPIKNGNWGEREKL